MCIIYSRFGNYNPNKLKVKCSIYGKYCNTFSSYKKQVDRNLDFIHSDTWQGSAAELAQRGYIAVFPVAGWWKERPNLERWHKQARYALIVSITTPNVETDIYTAVVNQIQVNVAVGVS